MRHYSALVKQILLGTAATLFFALGTRAAQGQVAFDDLDWTTDRGGVLFDPNPGGSGDRNAFPQRPGYNGVRSNPADPNFMNLDSKRAVRRWVWPRSIDVNTGGGNGGAGGVPAPSVSIIVDNPFFDGANGYLNKSNDGVFLDSQQSLDSDSVWTPTGGFVIPLVADRTEFGGFSFFFNPRESTGVVTDPPASAAGDYGATFAIHNDFVVDRPGNQPDGPATAAELAQFPNANPYVYLAVQKVLINDTLNRPFAQWSLGTQMNTNVGTGATPPGTYNVDIYSPGGGTFVTDANGIRVQHPNVQRAFVRVSWFKTIDTTNGKIAQGSGVPGTGGVNDPITSRIFLVDLSAPGWIHIGQQGRPAAVFPYDGTQADQIVVTMYSLTPDDPNDPAIYGTYPNGVTPRTALVTPDACRFTEENIQSNNAGPGLGPLVDGSFISSSGQVVSPVVGTNKFTTGANAGTTLWYVAREELTRDLTPRSYADPTDPNSLPIPDPTLVANVPVFYCLSNEDELIDRVAQTSRTSVSRVVWRYVGLPDGGSETVFASPVIANVRGRDNQYRTMVYFCGTSDTDQAGDTGRIYALDALGDKDAMGASAGTTTPYWTYPSLRPLSLAEFTAGNVPAQYEDPNYNGYNAATTAYPVNDPANAGKPGFWAGPDQTLFNAFSKQYWDGDIINDPVTGKKIARTDTQIHIGGISGAPIVMQDPVAPASKPMLLVVPSVDGRLYAFDAGGRGDFIQADKSIVAGTTQRLWTWPHYGADAYHWDFDGSSASDPKNQFADENGKGGMPFSPTYDPNFPFGLNSVNNPIMVSAGDGHIYAIKPDHDTLFGISNNNTPNWKDKRFWVYPHQGANINDPSATRLLDNPGVVTLYRPTQSNTTATVNFTSGGRIYQLQAPNTLPGQGYSTPKLNWVFPNTPNPPNEDPTDQTTLEYPQGFSGKGLTVVPASVATTPNDMAYAILNDGGLIAVNADTGTFYAAGQSIFTSTTDSAPVVMEIAPDPAFYSPVRTLNTVAQSVPAIVFGDSNGGMFGFKTIREDDGNGGFNLPIIYGRRDTGGELFAPPALAASTFLANRGGYYVVGDANGQVRAYSFGSGQFGDEETVPGTEGSSGFGANNVSIDMRILDAFTRDDYNKMAPAPPAAYGNAANKTSARAENKNPFANTATRLGDNLSDGGNTYFAMDEGGTLYLVASGVYHAQPVVNPVPPDGLTHGTGVPVIRVTFRVAQNGLPAVDYQITVTPTSNTNPNTPGDPNADVNFPAQRWPDDRAIALGDHDNLSIYGIDPLDPNPAMPTNGNPSGAKPLKGRVNNVFPWIARVAIPILPTSVAGKASFSPNTTGYQVSAIATITQAETIRTAMRTVTSTATDTDGLAFGQRNDVGKSLSAYGADQNNQNNNNFESKQRRLYITNPLALTVRGFDANGYNPAIPDLTGGNSNIIGWYGAIDRPGAMPGKGLELTGNGAYVGIGSALTGQPTGTIKPIFAPFDLTQDNATATYMGIDNSGQRKTALYVMDRSNLASFYGPIHIRAHINPLYWTGTARSVMNPLPFDTLPDSGAQSLDYPNLDPRYAQMVVDNRTDAIRNAATLRAPLDDPAHSGNPAYRIPQPTPISMQFQLPKYFPANVNRGQVTRSFRGTNIQFGGTFTDQAGFVRGVDPTAAGGAPYQIKQPIVGPLNTTTGIPNAFGIGTLQGSSPAGGYTGNVEVELVPPGATTTPGRVRPFPPQRATTNGQANRIFQTGICVAPTYRMKALETTLDVGSLPHGTGYSDIVPNTLKDGMGNFVGYPGANSYRFPFAPSATGPYQPAQNTGLMANLSSPWDVEPGYLSGLAALSGVPTEGRFFRPFTLVSDSNINLINLRIAKLLGPNSPDNSAAPDMTKVIDNSSFGVYPGAGKANSARLTSDEVNNLLSPVFAAPFGMTPAGGGVPGRLGNIGVVSSFDHDSYAQKLLGENNLYPLVNPAVDQFASQQSIDFQNLYGPLFGPAWAPGTQGRPTLHKPRVNDSAGSIATTPDQPHDYQYVANTLNPQVGTNNFIQQQQLLGVFNRPAIGIAVPLGTPVGTYSAPIFPYEDGLPIQWVEWLSSSNAGYANILGDNDDILNTTPAGAPSEPYANPAPTLRLTVRESRLTEGVTAGAMPQIDVRNTNGGYDPKGFNMQPAALLVPGDPAGSPTIFNKMFLYWTTNRQSGNNPKYIDPFGLPTPNAPLNIAYSALNLPYGNQNGYTRADAFPTGPVVADNFNIRLPQWWGVNDTNNTLQPFNLFPGFDGAGDPLDYLKLFPNTTVTAGAPQKSSVKYGSPATTLATHYDYATNSFLVDREAYLTTQGTVDRFGNPGATAPAAQQTETRTFVASLSNYFQKSEVGAPDFTGSTTDTWLYSFLNDPLLPKVSPRPLAVKLGSVPVTGGTQDMKFLYVFWHTGAQGRTSLYYNVNVATQLTPKFSKTGFNLLGDQKLPTPGALTWQSDPYPQYRRVFDPVSGQVVDAIDVMFTGVLKNRQTVEVLMARYRIVEQAVPASGNQPPLAVGQLVSIPFPTVHQETLTHTPGTNTWVARDAGWFLPSDTQTDTAANRYMRIYLGRGTNTYLINSLTSAQGAQRGRFDAASGLAYFNAVAVVPNTNQIALGANNRPVYGGGQIVVDPRSGTVSFPNIAPAKTDAVYASYTPYVMRINTTRDESNIERDGTDIGIAQTFGSDPSGTLQAILAQGHAGRDSAGPNYTPTYIMDRAPNTRGVFSSPVVMFDASNNPVPGTTPPIDRMWALYRKSDIGGKLNATVFMKTLRLVAKLPKPVATINTGNGTQKITSLKVIPAPVFGRPLSGKGYEVDWVRGRVYFHEEDEGNVVQISYTYFDPRTNATRQSGNLIYRVAWGDEISSTGDIANGDITTEEIAMRNSSSVNEGQIAAFKDPYIDKLWVFWSSTRAGTILSNNRQIGETDLYYETLAPQFYPPASNQF